jgi:23S rRNA (uracil1939-C5)-methyltransferase
MKKGDVIDIRIESLAFGGEGIGRFVEDERALAVFVEDTVPGDFVRARIGAVKRNFARGYIVEFIEKAPIRIEPRCKHFGSCGGCVLQYLAYEDQKKIKEQQVRDAIRRIGGFDESVVLPIIGCETPWYYRNKMEFSFSRDLEGKLWLGLHVKRRHHDVIELTECFLQNDYTGRLVVAARDFFRKKDAEGGISAEMQPMALAVREGKNSGEVMVNLIFENGEPEFLGEFVMLIRNFFGEASFTEVRCEANSGGVSCQANSPSTRWGPSPQVFQENLPGRKLASIYFTNIINKKGSRKLIQEKLLWGSPVIHEYLNVAGGVSLKFEISPQAFFQPNTKQAEVLYGEALKAARLTGRDAGQAGEETVFDLYCGAGTIGSFCAHSAKKVYGIEMNESAVKNAEANANLNGIKNIEFMCGDVAKILPDIRDKPDIVIIDPPRNGLDINAVKLIAGQRVQRIVYVSCNPATLARDLKLFAEAGYELEKVQPVDMFPQTYHIECVASLNFRAA